MDGLASSSLVVPPAPVSLFDDSFSRLKLSELFCVMSVTALVIDELVSVANESVEVFDFIDESSSSVFGDVDGAGWLNSACA